MKTLTYEEGGKIFALYQISVKPVPLVILISHCPNILDFMQQCSKKGCRQFNLLLIENLNWDADLSCWPSKPIVEENDDFKGRAPLLANSLHKALDYFSKEVQWQSVIIAGYSMGGLFALYSNYLQPIASHIVCASGSLWYPNFYEYAKCHDFKEKIKTIYLSLGTKEVLVKNIYLQQTGQIMENLKDFYTRKSIDCIFEWNPGNHFVQPQNRLIKGLYWTFLQIKTE